MIGTVEPQTTTSAAKIKRPINLSSKEFANNKYAYYKWLRENEPVHKGKMMSLIGGYLIAGYDDCVGLLKDDRFVRSRSTATGGRSFPLPLPKSLSMLMSILTATDPPDHRRLRALVHKTFTPRMLTKLEKRVETLTHELLDAAEKSKEQRAGKVAQSEIQIDLMTAYAYPIPVTIIAEMLGIDAHEIPEFSAYLESIINGMSGLSIIRTVAFDLPKSVKFIRRLIERKRTDPGDDIMTRLIEAEEDGDSLSEDELIAMVFTLIVAGHETTYHLIVNAVYTLLMHPEELARLQAEPALIDSAIEELMRFNGPIHGTDPIYAAEEVSLSGVTIPKGAMVMPLLGSANRDPAAFENPDVLDIARVHNRHLGFGQGIHYCLGAPLARMETRIALQTLFARYPNLRLAVSPDELEIVPAPGWHKYKAMPVVLE